MGNFSGKASRLAWELFKRTGEIGYYMLYANIENPPKLLETTLSNDSMER